MQTLYCFYSLCRGTADSGGAAGEGGVYNRGCRAHYHLPEHKEVAMKVVVLDRPKILSFFLRRIYGIKKTKDKQE